MLTAATNHVTDAHAMAIAALATAATLAGIIALHKLLEWLLKLVEGKP